MKRNFTFFETENCFFWNGKSLALYLSEISNVSKYYFRREILQKTILKNSILMCSWSCTNVCFHNLVSTNLRLRSPIRSPHPRQNNLPHPLPIQPPSHHPMTVPSLNRDQHTRIYVNHFSTIGLYGGPAHYDVSIRQAAIEAFITSSFKIFLTQTFLRCGATCYCLQGRCHSFSMVSIVYRSVERFAVIFASFSQNPKLLL